jgi:hypothetical protein
VDHVIETTVYRRYAGGGWSWHIATDDPGDILASGYARTQTGARLAVTRVRALLWLRWWPAETWWQLSYAIRPYDMLADRRRWCWQRRSPCLYCQRDKGDQQ